MHSERNHKRYSPSQADRFFACPGSAERIRKLPPAPPSLYAIEGTKAHEVVEAGLRNGARTAKEAHELSIHCCEEFADDFYAAIDDALNYVYQVIADLNAEFGDAVLIIEEKINVPCSALPGEADGHSDIAIYSLKGRVLYVIDYKHGVGVAKAVIGNKQVQQYAAGLVFGSHNLNDTMFDRVVLVIIQPRAFHPDGDIREYETTPAMLYDYLFAMDAAIEACEQPDAPLNPGEHCRSTFCEAAANCPALEAAALAFAGQQFATIRQVSAPALPDVSAFDVQRLSYAKQVIDTHLRTLSNAIDKRIDSLLRSGIAVPGFKLVESEARREWYGDEEESVTKLAALIGCSKEDLYERKRKALTHVEKDLTNAWKARVGRKQRKKAAEDAKQYFAYFTLKKTSGTLSVVGEDDPRPSVNVASMHYGNIAGLIPPPPTGV